MTNANRERLALEINAEHEAAQAHLRESLSHAIRVGELLIEARQSISRGEWLEWVEDNCAFSPRMAQNYVRLARKSGELETGDESSSGLSIRGALRSLSTTLDDQSVHFSSDSAEWFTPPEIIERVVQVLGRIDLDPCSNTRELAASETCSSCERTGEDRHLCSCGEILCEACNDRSHQEHDAQDAARPANVPAAEHHIRADDGLTKDWIGRVFVNPPYGREIGRWTTKLRRSFEAGDVVEAIALVPARTDAAWFADLRSFPRCFLHSRLKFSGADHSAPFPSSTIYLGHRVDRFNDVFREAGDVFVLYGGRHVPSRAPNGHRDDGCTRSRVNQPVEECVTTESPEQ